MEIATQTPSPDRRIVDGINRATTGEPVDRRTSQFETLGQGDFLRLLTVQLQQQDPFDPVDNTQMLAQMAQFSTLAGTTETNAALADIAGKLDALIAAQATQANQAPAPQQSETGQ